MSYLLWHYLAESASKFPDRPAVQRGGVALTYAELDARSTGMANLLTEAGIGAGMRVGLYMDKSPDSIVAMHGIMKSGAAYVPIDPAAPAARATYILGDCAVSGIVTTTPRLKALLDAEPLPSLRAVVLLDEQAASPPANVFVIRWSAIAEATQRAIAAPPVIETDPAYLLYTSGSTGRPKGVILTHRNAMAFVEWGVALFSVTETDRLSSHAPLHFDLSVFDTYAALKSGACVDQVPEEIAPFPRQLAQWIDTERITIWYSVPSALTRMLLHGRFERFQYSSLRHLLFAGEVFPVKYLRVLQALLPRVELWNLYGPTETNVCTYYRVPILSEHQASDIPIGRACENTAVFAVTDEGTLAGPGEVGELVVRGPTVMPGYWGLPERTAKALVKNPLQPAYGEPAYLTGDYVRLREDGNYDFIGRRDNQVKSRGYRIELGEIEQVVYRHDGVREAAVVAIPDQEVGARLRLVVAAQPGVILTRKDIETFCQAHLPRYMVPEMIDFMADLPRTSTGKTDRVALAGEAATVGAGE